jgi:ribose transport system substrate-binding protein
MSLDIRRPALVATAALTLTSMVLAPVARLNNSVAQAAKIKIAYIVGQTQDPFYASMSCGARDEGKALGVTVNIQGPQTWGVTNQTPIVNAVVASHPDAMVVVPNDPKAMIAPIQAGAKAGIKIVLADTTLNDTSFVSARVSTDNVAAGRVVADTLAKLVNYKGTVMIAGYTPGGASTVDDRVKGFNEELKKYPNIKNIGAPYQLPAGSSGTAEVQDIVGVLDKYPNLSGMFGTAVISAEDAATAIRQAGVAGKIKVVGFDTADVQIAAMKKGIFQALIGQEPYVMGQIAVKQAMLAVEGKKTTSFTGTPAVVVTPANLNTPAVQKLVYKFNC